MFDNNLCVKIVGKMSVENVRGAAAAPPTIIPENSRLREANFPAKLKIINFLDGALA